MRTVVQPEPLAVSGNCTPPRCDWARFSVEIRDRHTTFPEKPGQLCFAFSQWLLLVPRGSIKLDQGKRIFTALEDHEFFLCHPHSEAIARALPYLARYFTRI